MKKPRICAYCNLPAPTGKKSHQHCTNAKARHPDYKRYIDHGAYIGSIAGALIATTIRVRET